MMDQINDILSNMSQEDMDQITSLANSLLGGNFNNQQNNQNNNQNNFNSNNNYQGNTNDQNNNQQYNNQQNSFGQNNFNQNNNSQNNFNQNNNPIDNSNQSGIGDIFGSIDPATIAKISTILGKLNSKKDDQRIILIKALIPLLSDERKVRAERAIKFIGMYELLPEIKNLNLF